MRKRKLVMLTITEYCNLDCVYCYESEKTKNIMDIQTAKNAVEYAFDNSDGFDEIEFDLFGGEPTLRKKLIVELVEWTLFKGFGKPFLFFIQTNGTLIHGNFQKWLIENKEYVYVGLSLDGTPETHNKNRNNSYNKIDIDFFVNTFPRQGARMTINTDTVGNLFNDVTHFYHLGFSRVDAFFAFGIDWRSDQVKFNLKRELRKLCDFYLENPNVKECSIFEINLPELLKEKKVQKWCGTGTDMISFAVDGKMYPCQMFQPNSLSKPLKPVELGEIDFNAISDFNDLACSDCILEPICPNCYGMNYLASGDILNREKGLCEIMKIRTLAVSYLRAKQIENGIKELEPAEMYQTIKAIKMVQSEFLAV